jgi:hypothetical protein
MPGKQIAAGLGKKDLSFARVLLYHSVAITHGSLVNE